MPLIFYDLETTGLNPYHSRIIEIGAVKYENGNVSTFSEIVNPEVKLSHFTIDYTGITNEMVQDKDTIDIVIKRFIKFCGNDSPYLVAHNNDGFDKLFLENIRNFKDYSKNVKYIDTLKLSRRLLPNKKGHKLVNLCNYFNIKYGRGHRALHDSELLDKVYSCLLDIANITHPYEIEKFIYNNPIL